MKSNRLGLSLVHVEEQSETTRIECVQGSRNWDVSRRIVFELTVFVVQIVKEGAADGNPTLLPANQRGKQAEH